ncbi:S-layer homology domain-containing protein [Peptoniphilus equinus]|uniref:S-layer homology domain-containing protein n=1 Tax=Peptoniphilus equinus TaxID=3016343 RepID=A0ABY7QTG9_9FIRM|nr:S-layer homology domain-containing protein [Peptoniphilus equinus]WBW50091.1 S-layer homology domain-containing protein [Peptoniphilus equinus]
MSAHAAVSEDPVPISTTFSKQFLYEKTLDLSALHTTEIPQTAFDFVVETMDAEELDSYLPATPYSNPTGTVVIRPGAFVDPNQKTVPFSHVEFGTQHPLSAEPTRYHQALTEVMDAYNADTKPVLDADDDFDEYWARLQLYKAQHKEKERFIQNYAFSYLWGEGENGNGKLLSRPRRAYEDAYLQNVENSLTWPKDTIAFNDAFYMMPPFDFAAFSPQDPEDYPWNDTHPDYGLLKNVDNNQLFLLNNEPFFSVDDDGNTVNPGFGHDFVENWLAELYKVHRPFYTHEAKNPDGTYQSIAMPLFSEHDLVPLKAQISAVNDQFNQETSQYTYSVSRFLLREAPAGEDFEANNDTKILDIYFTGAGSAFEVFEFMIFNTVDEAAAYYANLNQEQRIGSIANLTPVTFTNVAKGATPVEPELTTIHAEKVWLGQNPDHFAVMLNLYRHTAQGDRELVAQNPEITERIDNGRYTYDYLWKDLPVKDANDNLYRYSVQEVGETDGKFHASGHDYKVTYSGSALDGFTVTNTKDDDVPNPWVPIVTSKPNDVSHLNTQDHYQYLFGYPEHTFEADASMTRGEVTMMFARLMKNKPSRTDTFDAPFSDVANADWYHDAIAIMNDKKIITGYPDGNFGPNAPITRAEFAAMASRFTGMKAADMTFSDVDESHWAYKYIQSAVALGWVNGFPDGTFKPEQPITRAEVATITDKMLSRAADKAYVDTHQDRLDVFTDLDHTHWAYYNIMEAVHGHEYERAANTATMEETWTELTNKAFDIYN